MGQRGGTGQGRGHWDTCSGLTSSDTLNLRSSATTFCLKFCCCETRGQGHTPGTTSLTTRPVHSQREGGALKV